MTLFKVVEVDKMEGAEVYGRVLDGNLVRGEANSLYSSSEAKRKGPRTLQGTPTLMRQDDENSVEVEQE